MADIHPEVQDLLNALLTSGLPNLGKLATERILEKEDGGFSDIGSEGEIATRRPAPKTADGFLQLRLADEAVREVLDLELALFDRTASTVEAFRELQQGWHIDDSIYKADRLRPTPLETVMAIETSGKADTPGAHRVEDFLSKRRRDSLRNLLDAWTAGVGETEKRLQTRAAD